MDYVLMKAFINGFECTLLFVGNVDSIVEYAKKYLTPQLNFFVIKEDHFNQLCNLGIKAYFIPFDKNNDVKPTNNEKTFNKESILPDSYNSLKTD